MANDLKAALERILEEPKNTMSDGKALKAIVRIAKDALASHTGEAEPVRNQCDGCALAIALNKFGHHKYPDGSLIACTASRYICFCGSPSAPGVTHRYDGACFLEDTHQDYNPLATPPAATPVAPGEVTDGARWRFAMDWGTKDFAVCYRDENAWVPIKTNGPIDAALFNPAPVAAPAKKEADHG